MRHRKPWKYKNLTLLMGSLIAAFLLLQLDSFQALLLRTQEFGYFSIFVAGMLFVSTFTVSIGAVILLALTEQFSPLAIAFIAALGAVVFDSFIFHMARNNLAQELHLLYRHFGGRHFSHLLHSTYFAWTLPVLGALIIASPLPDELGVSLLGISRMKSYQFLILSFILNFIGIFLIAYTSSIVSS